VVSAFRLSRRAFAARGKRRGTRIGFRLSEAATVRLTIVRRLGGRRTKVVGTLRRRAHAGANHIAFSGRLGRRALRAGRYRLVLRATDAAGNRSRSHTRSFTVLGS
jgi:hypothetical protein